MIGIFYDSAKNDLWFINTFLRLELGYSNNTKKINISNHFFVDDSCYAKNPINYKEYDYYLANDLRDFLKELIQCDEVIWDNICPKTGEKSHRVRIGQLRMYDTSDDYNPYLLASILECVDCMKKYNNTDVHATGLNFINAYAITENVACMAQARYDGVDVHSTIARKKMFSGELPVFSNAYMRACCTGDLKRMQQAFDDGIDIRLFDSTTSSCDGLELAESSRVELAVELAKKHLKLTEEKEE